MDKMYVEVVSYETDEVVKSIGPMGEWKVNKVDRGMNINLNHDKYYTIIVEK